MGFVFGERVRCRCCCVVELGQPAPVLKLEPGQSEAKIALLIPTLASCDWVIMRALKTRCHLSLRKVDSVPHSWAVTAWPPGIYPHNSDKGRYIVRAHRDELVAAGALTRIGRDLVIFGAGYNAWLHKQADKVAGFEIAPNKKEKRTVAGWLGET